MALLTTSYQSGAPVDNYSVAPVFSGDRRTLIAESWASELAARDFNHGSDIIVLQFLYASINPAAAPGNGPTITWPARPGENYQVKFKTTLTDPVWQDVGGTVTIENGWGRLTDQAATQSQRFYRVLGR